LFTDMPELLDDIRTQVTTRLQELRPLVQEAEDLERALDALQGAPRRAEGNGRRRATTAQSRNGSPAARKPRQRRDVRTAVVDYIRAHPGSTAGDVAKALKLNRNSIATRLAQLAKAGDLTKAKRGYATP
jgi:cell division septum initiation protein DivIVA